VEFKTAINSGKKRTGLQDPQEDTAAGILESSKRGVQQVAEGEELDPVEGSAPSEAEKEAPLT
jgi:hypothetical protein